MTVRWTEQSIPDLAGRTFVVTGATSGLGWETARALSQHGAHVVVGGRTEAKARQAIDRIGATDPSGTLAPWAVGRGPLGPGLRGGRGCSTA